MTPLEPPPGVTTPPRSSRKLMAIVYVDMAGYSRLIGFDVLGTLQRLRDLRENVIDTMVADHGGTIYQTAGDSLLLTFDSVTGSVACAIGIQRGILALNVGQPSGMEMMFRIGIDIGDVIADGNDLHGNGVNIAVRLQAECPVGDIYISRNVYDHVRYQVDAPVEPLGLLNLKNIESPIEAFRLRIVGTQPQIEDVGIGLPGGRIRHAISPLITVPHPEMSSIAVLPFRSLSRRHNDIYFADGIVEEIIHALSGIKELFVISRGSTLRYSGINFNVRSVAEELGVRYILHGSVRHSARNLKIQTELTDTTDLSIVQSDQYEGKMRDIFSMQSDIAVQVASAVVPHVRERELRQTMRKPPSSLTAFDLVLQALDALYKVKYDSLLRARQLLIQAMALDPDYAPAYTYAAYCSIFLVGEGWSQDIQKDAREAADYAAKAVERDPNDAVALAIGGHVRSFLLHDYEAAMRFLDRAIEAGPSCALAWTMSSATCGYLGQGPLAVERAERGLRLSPLDARAFWPEAILGQAHYINGNYERAVEWTRKAFGHCETAIFNLRTLTASLVAAGQLDEARKIAQRLLLVMPDFHLIGYMGNCPFREDILAVWINRLREAGLPD